MTVVQCTCFHWPVCTKICNFTIFSESVAFQVGGPVYEAFPDPSNASWSVAELVKVVEDAVTCKFTSNIGI